MATGRAILAILIESSRVADSKTSVMPTYIDAQALQAITALQRPGKPDLLMRVVCLFETESPKMIQSIVDGVSEADLEVVGTAAHTLKSSSAYVGARLVSDRCRQIEHAARAGNYPECLVLAEDLEAEYQSACEELRQHLDKAA